MNRTIIKPTENLVFNPYNRRISDLIEDLDCRLDDMERETLQLVLELVYKSGFEDGIFLLRWLEE